MNVLPTSQMSVCSKESLSSVLSEQYLLTSEQFIHSKHIYQPIQVEMGKCKW